MLRRALLLILLMVPVLAWGGDFSEVEPDGGEGPAGREVNLEPDEGGGASPFTPEVSGELGPERATPGNLPTLDAGKSQSSGEERGGPEATLSGTY